jgi:hypothetical protein
VFVGHFACEYHLSQSSIQNPQSTMGPFVPHSFFSNNDYPPPEKFLTAGWSFLRRSEERLAWTSNKSKDFTTTDTKMHKGKEKPFFLRVPW